VLVRQKLQNLNPTTIRAILTLLLLGDALNSLLSCGLTKGPGCKLAPYTRPHHRCDCENGRLPSDPALEGLPHKKIQNLARLYDLPCSKAEMRRLSSRYSIP